MKTRLNTTAWLKLVILDGDRDAIMVAATTERGGDRVAIGRIAERAGGPPRRRHQRSRMVVARHAGAARPCGRRQPATTRTPPNAFPRTSGQASRGS